MTRKAFLLCAALALQLLFAQPGLAQAYTARLVRVVVPYPPGGGNDALARLFAQRLGEKWGEPAIVDNRPGASGNIGADYVVKSPADGYTLLVMPTDLAINPGLYRKMPYDAAKDLAPIAMMASVPEMIAVHPSSGIGSLADLVKQAKARPGALSYASCGTGTPAHLAGEMLKSMAGIELLHVLYKGCGPAHLDAVSGQVPIVISTAANLLPFIKTGKLRAIAITSRARSRLAPAVPTVAEQGFPDYVIENWFGLLAPSHTPAQIVGKVSADVAEILADPKFIEKLTDNGFEPMPGNPQAFRDLIARDTRRFGVLIKKIGATAE
ncbi:MAG: tripartite tricarboxylate transporter substrate binding protein [Candidatus Protistobacter heckmanni]|nr:tripartite tricarboxylate transporter substrate binding protein [Candidatus Protistobacter heckmanni]